MSRLTVVLLAAVAALGVACSGSEPASSTDASTPPPPHKEAIGGACTSDDGCESGNCNAGLPGGYCSEVNCAACPDGSTCHAFGGFQQCFRSCSAAGDCREGYQCFDGVCTPKCAAASDCGTGYLCNSGACVKKPATVTTSCTTDDQCKGGVCLQPEKKCSKLCTSTSDCGGGEVCSIREGLDVSGNSKGLRAACVTLQGGAATGSTCRSDTDCASRLCHIGMCTEVCKDTCPGTLGCFATQQPARFDQNLPFKGCLPQKGTLVWDTTSFSTDFQSSVPVPSNTVAFALTVGAANTSLTPAVLELVAPDSKQQYVSPQTEDDLFKEPIRYYPDKHVSAMLVTNNPAFPLQRTGPYHYQSGVYNDQGAYVGGTTNRIVYKFAKGGAVSTGTLNLNFYLANMANHPCASGVTPSNAATQLSKSIDTIKRIYGKAGITIGKVSFQAMNDANYQSLNGDDPNALAGLFAKSAGQGTKGINIFLVRSLSPQGLLGVAGGIPGPYFEGTAHSGVVVTMSAYCYGVLGNVISHESGHFLGLFHNVEQDASQSPSHTDPLTDTDGSSDNLMYWNEQGGETLSPGQGFVMRNNPLVEVP